MMLCFYCGLILCTTPAVLFINPLWSLLHFLYCALTSVLFTNPQWCVQLWEKILGWQ